MSEAQRIFRGAAGVRTGLAARTGCKHLKTDLRPAA
jgi:hypothetical protein